MRATANRNYNRIRSALIRRGLTLRQWAMQRGYHVNTVYMAAKGLRGGARSVQIIKELEEHARGSH